MKILVLGADGYLGWPLCMHLSAQGHEVAGIDNYWRRNSPQISNSRFLYQTPLLPDRCLAWNEKSGKSIHYFIGDLADPSTLNTAHNHFQQHLGYGFSFDSIVHLAEQPSAPFSVSSEKNADFTLMNNLRVTHNILWYMKHTCKDAQLVKLGTMGEYGTPNIDIEEGWLDISHKGRTDKFLFPRQAGSLYHTTKILDTDLIWYYTRIWGLRVTDLMQGPVYGICTDESDLSTPQLLTSFNYDDVFGTVVNRFAVMAALNFPLTIYGKGNQTRGYIHITDSMQCIHASIQNPAEQGELRIFNQITETLSVNEIAHKVCQCAKNLGMQGTIQNIDNPRIEKEEHYYNPVYQGLTQIGVNLHSMNDATLASMINIASSMSQNIDKSVFLPAIKW